ncbi:zinc finger protein ZFP2-like [Antennarius striatus]|uniref:zinc finger protein ZFP2-like n=1 Tax=Antennarius striatus TaxID=241820 RepID=UPI0035B2599C
MCDVQTLRAFVLQRLTAAAEDIMEQFERTLANHENQEQLCGRQKLLDGVFGPQVHLQTADVQLMLVTEEAVDPEQQDLRSNLDRDVQPEPPHMKQEPEEVQTNQEDEQLQGMKEEEEEDVTELILSSVPVKSEEDDEEIPQSSRLHDEDMKAEADGQPELEPNSYFQRDGHLQPDEDQMSRSSEPEELEETSEPQSDFNQLRNNQEPKSHPGKNYSGVQTGKKTFSCSVCDKRYKRKPTLRAHMRLHSNDKCFNCSVCKKTFPFKSSYERHVRTHTGEKPFRCSVCGKEFGREGNLWLHMKTHSGEKPFSCLVCGKGFGRGGHLKRHMRIHTGEKPFECSACGKGFQRVEHRNQHLRIHTKEEPCSPLCDVLLLLEDVPPEQQDSRPRLDQNNPPEVPHIKGELKELNQNREHHEQTSDDVSEEKPMSSKLPHTEQIKTETDGEECGEPQPGKRFTVDGHSQPDTEELVLHSCEPEDRNSSDPQETSRPQSEPECHPRNLLVCSPEGGSSSRDKKHLQEHSGVQTFGCSVCYKTYQTTHKRLHPKDKCLSCSVCKKTFKFKSACVRHMRTHTGEKPFKCSQCGKEFGQPGNLWLHMKIHTGEKPFRCSLCGKVFGRGGHLRQHMRTHKDKPIS